MLNKHLIVKNNRSKSVSSNIVFWKKYRVSVLQDCLIRVEKSDEGVFLDSPTQIVWYRDMPKQAYSVTKNAKTLIIKTKKIKLVLKENRDDWRVIINNKEISVDNSENLLGTYKTLDGYDGEYFIGNGANTPYHDHIKLDMGVCSKNGVAVIKDNSLILEKNGELSTRDNNHIDEYIFAYGNDYKGAIRGLYLISGNVPLIPRYALGNWWCRYHAYTDKTYLSLMNKFVEKEFPITVAIVDMDWHYSANLDEDKKITALNRNNEFYGFNNGWTGYSWNKKLFPNYKKFLKQLHDMNLKVTLNLHPAEGVRWFEDCYEKFALSMGLNPKDEKRIEFDFTNTQFINSYFSIIHKPYERDGVDFWWIDWQQGDKSKIPGLDPLWALNHYHFLDHAKNHRNGLILSRYAGIGSHRYSLGFSGDTYITWDTLNFLPYFTSNATNVGFTNWSHDIGGHQCGEMDFELYVRLVQLGVFSPILRLHCQTTEIMTKEPWLYKNGAGHIALDFFRLRHKMIPLLYTMSYRNHYYFEPLIMPLYYEVNDIRSFEYKNEYIFAKDMIVIPITSKLDESGIAKTKGYLPKGRYVDFFTNQIYLVNEDRELEFYRYLDSIPVLVKAGSVIPLSADKGNTCLNPTHLNLIVYVGNGSYTLFEDNENNELLKTIFINKKLKNKQVLEFEVENEESVIPAERKYTIDFKDIIQGKVQVFENGKKIIVDIPCFEFVRVKFVAKKGAKYKIVVSYDQEDLTLVRKSLYKELTSLQEKNLYKDELWQKLDAANDIKSMRKIILDSTLKESQKGILLEHLYID